MAHPHSEHREHKAGRDRARHILKDGGHGNPSSHSDEAADKRLFNRMIAQHESKVHGIKAKGRLDKYARGGRTKHGAQVNIAIVTPHGKDKDHDNAAASPAVPPPGAGLAARPPMPPPGAMPPPPMGGPPPGMGAMPPPGMRPPGRPFKRGGKVGMTAGSFTGEGRLQKKKAYGLKPAKKTAEE